MLLTRNLLYTAITRAKKLLVLIGNEKVIEFMINNSNSRNRNTGLMFKLKGWNLKEPSNNIKINGNIECTWGWIRNCIVQRVGNLKFTLEGAARRIITISMKPKYCRDIWMFFILWIKVNI